MSSYSEYLSRQQQRLQKFVDTRPHRDAGHQTEVIKRRAAAAVLESTNPRSAGVLVLDGPSTQVRSFYAKAHNVQDASVFAGFEAAQAVAQSEIPRNAKASQIREVCYSSTVVPEYNDRLRTDTQLGLVQAARNAYLRGNCCTVCGKPPRGASAICCQIPRTIGGGGGPTDAIAASLTTSLAAYTAAATGTWVNVTSTEYNAMKTAISGTSVSGNSDGQYLSLSTNWTTPGFLGTGTFGGANSVRAPSNPGIAANNYLYAFVFYLGNKTGVTIRVFANNSAGTYSNFTQVGTDITPQVNGNNYLILKGSTTQTGALGGDLCIFSTDMNTLAIGNTGWGLNYTQTYPLPSPLNLTNGNYTVGYQGLSTPTKQW